MQTRIEPTRSVSQRMSRWSSCAALRTPACVAIFIVAFGCGTPNATPATPTWKAPANELDAAVQREFERQELVGLSVAIVHDHDVVYTHHLGFEDREQHVATSAATMYRLASISKPLTAVVAVQLAHEGKLALDRDVREYVPEFPSKPFTITSRELLCHQGGIVHYTNGPVIQTPARTDVAHPYEDAVDALATFAASPLVCEPGTQYSYSTHGYVLLGAVLQRASGTPFEDLVAQRIVRPLGLETLRPDKQWVAIPHRTVGYQRNDAHAIVPSVDSDVSWKLAGGGFIACVADLVQFGSGMLNDRLVDRATREEMWTRQSTKSGTVTDYGLGFRIDTYRGRRLVMHSGSQEKTRTRLLILPEDGFVIALMCNSEWADLQPLGQQLTDVLLDAHRTP